MFTAPAVSAQDQAEAARRLAAHGWKFAPDSIYATASFQLENTVIGAARRVHLDMLKLGIEMQVTEEDAPADLGRLLMPRPKHFTVFVAGASQLRRFAEAILPHAPAALQRDYANYQASHGQTRIEHGMLSQNGNVYTLSPNMPRPVRWWHSNMPLGVRPVTTLALGGTSA